MWRVGHAALGSSNGDLARDDGQSHGPLTYVSRNVQAHFLLLIHVRQRPIPCQIPLGDPRATPWRRTDTDTFNETLDETSK